MAVDVAGFADGPDQAMDEFDDLPLANQPVDDDDEFVAPQAEQALLGGSIRRIMFNLIESLH